MFSWKPDFVKFSKGIQNFFGLGTPRISSGALGKHIAPMDFAEYLRKSDDSENSKVRYGLF